MCIDSLWTRWYWFYLIGIFGSISVANRTSIAIWSVGRASRWLLVLAHSHNNQIGNNNSIHLDIYSCAYLMHSRCRNRNRNAISIQISNRRISLISAGMWPAIHYYWRSSCTAVYTHSHASSVMRLRNETCFLLCMRRKIASARSETISDPKWFESYVEFYSESTWITNSFRLWSENLQ